MAAFHIQAVTVSEPANARGLDLKKETLPRISYVQYQVKFQKLWQNNHRSTLLCCLTELVDSSLMKMFSAHFL
jgi:hypothetical protein